VTMWMIGWPFGKQVQALLTRSFTKSWSL